MDLFGVCLLAFLGIGAFVVMVWDVQQSNKRRDKLIDCEIEYNKAFARFVDSTLEQVDCEDD